MARGGSKLVIDNRGPETVITFSVAGDVQIDLDTDLAKMPRADIMEWIQPRRNKIYRLGDPEAALFGAVISACTLLDPRYPKEGRPNLDPFSAAALINYLEEFRNIA